MSVIGLLKLNIKEMFRQRFLLGLLIFIELTSVILIMFSYGVINHFNTKTKEVEGTSMYYVIGHIDDELQDPQPAEVKAFISSAIPIVSSKLERVYFGGFNRKSDEGVSYDCISDYRNGKLIPVSLAGGIGEGRGFEDTDADTAEKIALVPETYESDEINIAGQQFRCIGKYKVNMYSPASRVYIPYYAFPENNIEVLGVTMRFTKPLTLNEHNKLAQLAAKYVPQYEFPEFDGIDNESDNRVYRSIIGVAIVFMAISAINYCIMYKHILAKRRRILAVSRICGCTGTRASIVYFIELYGLSVILLVIGLLIFHCAILPAASGTFEYMSAYMTTKTYLKISGIYLGMLLVVYVILIGRFVRKTPAELIRSV